jgi:hydrogenase expression/formation protein HypE
LNEIARQSQIGIIVNEASIPVRSAVASVCEMLGFDPMYLANEGKVLIVAGAGEAKKILDILRSDPLGINSEIIGEIIPEKRPIVILNTSVGGKRILDMSSGQQFPRIC